MSRSRPSPTFLSAWCESSAAHHCDRLIDALHDAVYDVFLTTQRGRRISRRRYQRKRVLVIAPNVERVIPGRDRLRFCPFCGSKLRALAAPPKHLAPAKVPDHLPPDVT